MQSKKVVEIRAEVGAQGTPVDASLGRGFPDESEQHRGPVVGHLNGLGPALIDAYEAGAEYPTKMDLLDQVVSIVRRKKRPDERVLEIAILMRNWQEMCRD